MFTTLVKLVGASWRAINDFLGKNGPQLSAAISYYTLFSLFPLIVAIISGLSFLLGQESIDELANRVAQQSPVSEETISEIITSAVNSRNIAGIVGILGLLWAGTAVFGSIRKGINATWGITRPRSFLKERLIDITFMVVAAVLMLISIFSTAILTYLMEILEFITRETYVDGALLWERLASALPPTLSFIVFFAIYWLLPNTNVKITEPLPGAIFATTGFEILKNVFVWFIGNSSIYSTIYGSVGSIVVLLVWVYVSSIILLFGSTITSRFSQYSLVKEKEIEDIVKL
ncbi:MAG: YihY/virulence factor BrkB family protein [Dehalococcoidia bacterium]|nr:YihY/virulence factor BrkB family protein [Dehalococcoidia bacterium]